MRDIAEERKSAHIEASSSVATMNHMSTYGEAVSAIDIWASATLQSSSSAVSARVRKIEICFACASTCSSLVR